MHDDEEEKPKGKLKEAKRKAEALAPEPTSDADTNGDSDDEDEGDVWLYGYDSSTRLAWKAKPANKETIIPCDEIVEPPGADLNDQVVAVWSDGSRWKVSNMTVKRWRSLKRDVSGHFQEADTHFRGVHKVTQHAIRVRTRQDMKELISIQEHGKQILQLTGDTLGNLQDTATFMIGIAKLYCENKITKEGLRTYRDDELAPSDIAVPGKRAQAIHAYIQILARSGITSVENDHAFAGMSLRSAC